MARSGWKVRGPGRREPGGPGVQEAFDTACAAKGGPSVIIADTVKGKGISFAENTAAFHNGIMTREQYEMALAELDRRLQALGGRA